MQWPEHVAVVRLSKRIIALHSRSYLLRVHCLWQSQVGRDNWNLARRRDLVVCFIIFSTTCNFLKLLALLYCNIKKNVKWSHHRSGVAQRVGRGIALFFHDRGIRRGRVASSTPRPHFTPGKDPVPVLQETECSPGPVWTGRKSGPHRDPIPERPASSQSL